MDAVTQQLPGNVVVERVLLALAAGVAPLSVEPAFVLRKGTCRTDPLVWARLADTLDMLMTPATAREVGVRIAASPWTLAVIDDPAALGQRFTQAADEAESLAAAQCKEPPVGQSH